MKFKVCVTSVKENVTDNDDEKQELQNIEKMKRTVCQKVKMIVLTGITKDCHTALNIYRKVL